MLQLLHACSKRFNRIAGLYFATVDHKEVYLEILRDSAKEVTSVKRYIWRMKSRVCLS